MKTICLFCASLDGKDPLYSKTAKEFGIVLAKHQCSFLYGGGSLGLMGININNFWDPFIQMLEHMKINGLIRSEGDKNLSHASLKNLFVVKDLNELSKHPSFNIS